MNLLCTYLRVRSISGSHNLFVLCQPRRVNNHTLAAAREWQKLAAAVSYAYGHRYQRAIEYLNGLSANTSWQTSQLNPLPWHSQPPGDPDPGRPYVMHQSVLNMLAPSVPLRAVFSRE